MFKFIDDTYKVFIPNTNQIQITYDKNENKDSNHIVMWSGGTDSTLLLYELLQTYGPEKVIAISYNYPWLLKSKFEMENRYRELFKAKLRIVDPRLADFNHSVMTISVDNMIRGNHDNNRIGYIQAASWLLSIPQFATKNSYIYLGSIINDELETVKSESLNQLFEGICGVIGKDLYLRRPYLLFKKFMIIQKLIEYKLYDSTWFCEMPYNTNNKICGKCNPCLTHLEALHTLAYLYESCSEYVKTQAKEIYDRLTSPDQYYTDKKPIEINLTDNKQD